MSQQHEVDQANAGKRRKPRGVFALRPYVVLVVFLAAGVGIIFHTGWGTLSSMGWRAVAWVCPLGALETLLAGGSDALRTGMALGVMELGVPRAVGGGVFSPERQAKNQPRRPSRCMPWF